jgi:hypothetical protein
VRIDNECHFMVIKGAIHQEEITVRNLHTPTVRPNLTNHTVLYLKTQIDPNTVMVGGCNTPLWSRDKSFTQKINKEILELNNTIDQMYLMDIYWVVHSATAQYKVFSAAHGTFSKGDLTLGHKASLNK